jgi:predicted acylesterase/phospholipase RssA
MTSLEGVLSASNAEPAGHPAVAGQVVLVMQGGGAQAAYQGGVYQALHEANLEPDWVIGTSIGAINGSIIAGNKVASRLERLREFGHGSKAGQPGHRGRCLEMRRTSFRPC